MNKPPGNIIISACAGSGKTYALIQRLLQLLKDGAAPGEILAITFTRKAAAEIETRLLEALQEHADSADTWAADCLRRILFPEQAADELNVYTFHSWFGLLLSGRRWTANWYGPAGIAEDDSQLRAEAWRRWLDKMEKQMPAELTAVLQVCSPYVLRELLTNDLVHRANAWQLRPPDEMPLPDTHTAAQSLQDALKQLINVVGAGIGQKTYQTARQAAVEYIESAAQNNLLQVEKSFFTGSGGLRKNLCSVVDKKGGMPQLLMVEQALNDCLDCEAEYFTLTFHRTMCVLAEAYFKELTAVKIQNNQMSFDELEYESYQAVREFGDVNTLLYRINHRFRHLLIDEFQDTSPLQWQIIACWLRAAHGDSALAPSVFIVGDEKQAIYGFRHGDARLLGEAQRFLKEYYQVKVQENDICWRLAEPLLQVVNAVFPLRLPGFIPHQLPEKNQHLPGRVEWRQLEFNQPAAVRGSGMRNPLLTPAAADDKRIHWAQAVSEGIVNIIGNWRIIDKATATPRAATAEDVLVLLPQLTHVQLLHNFLQQAGVPCSVRGGKTSFANTLACRDIVALIKVLLAPENSLSLAQVLKSPLFALSEDALLTTAAAMSGGGTTLWKCLLASTLPPARAAAEVLQGWRRQALSGRLPAHDLLAHIYKDGDVYARYRAAVAPPYRRQVEADLSALLDFSLAGDGGRQPLLQQFIDALSAAAPPPADAAGVRLMTVHGAKGLEAPIVVLADCSFGKRYSGGGGRSVQILVNWRPGQPAPAAFIFRPAAQERAYRKLAQEEEKRAEREYDNLFYVALTRARQGLCIYSLPDDANPRLEALCTAMTQHAVQQEDGAWVAGDDLAGAEDAAPPAAPADIAPAATAGEQIETAPVQRGKALHQLAALLLQGYQRDEITALTEEADTALLDEAARLLEVKQLRQLLNDSRRYEVEAEFVDRGKVLRVDLLIFTDEAIWIIDYKTGHHNLTRYEQQMNDYIQAVTAIYAQPPVRAAFITPRGFYPYAPAAAQCDE